MKKAMRNVTLLCAVLCLITGAVLIFYGFSLTGFDVNAFVETTPQPWYHLFHLDGFGNFWIGFAS